MSDKKSKEDVNSNIDISTIQNDIFRPDKIYKVVWRDDDKVKTAKTYITGNSTHYLILAFPASDLSNGKPTLKYISHHSIITITEVDNEEEVKK